MAAKTTVLSLSYSRLESIPEDVLEDPWFQEHLLKMHLKQNLIEELVSYLRYVGRGIINRTPVLRNQAQPALET